jgi:DNA-binding NarL/FixJ family response regulator
VHTLDKPVDSKAADRIIQEAIDVLAGRTGPRASKEREALIFTLVDHARDGGCIHAVDGECPRAKVARILATAGPLPVAKPTASTTGVSLSEREMQVLLGMSEGRTNAEIGRRFYITEDTVKTHSRRLFRKLDVRDRAHAVAVAYQTGILRLPEPAEEAAATA